MEYSLVLFLFQPMTGETGEANGKTSEDEGNAGQRNYRFLDRGQTPVCYPSSPTDPPRCISTFHACPLLPSFISVVT